MKNNLYIPIAVLIAGGLIAGAIFLDGEKGEEPKNNPNGNNNAQENTKISLDYITKNDYIMGNPDAEVFVVTYTDVECPFCKRHHETILDIMQNEDYAKNGKVAWVIRHFPITNLHPLAVEKSSALECAGILGGEDTFWNYTNTIFEKIPLRDSMSLEKFKEIAGNQGLNKDDFAACIESNETKKVVTADYDLAISTYKKMQVKERFGTPFNIIISKESSGYVMGAQSRNVFDSKIRSALDIEN